mgnify:CR=1 FL=1
MIPKNHILFTKLNESNEMDKIEKFFVQFFGIFSDFVILTIFCEYLIGRAVYLCEMIYVFNAVFYDPPNFRPVFRSRVTNICLAFWAYFKA